MWCSNYSRKPVYATCDFFSRQAKGTRKNKEGDMARRGQHSFLKRQKEIKRKEEAAGKMARRQGKEPKAGIDEDGPQATDVAEGEKEG